jgi:hypothetical protein
LNCNLAYDFRREEKTYQNWEVHFVYPLTDIPHNVCV